MAITTLLSALLVGGTGMQTKPVVEINVKCCTVADTEVKFEGKKVSMKRFGQGDSVTLIEGFEETKLVKDAGAVIGSAPTIRTFSGQEASLTFTRNHQNAPFTVFTVGSLPTVKSDGSIDLELKFSEVIGEGKESRWSYSTSAAMGTQSKAWFIQKGSFSQLYIVKASLGKPAEG